MAKKVEEAWRSRTKTQPQPAATCGSFAKTGARARTKSGKRRAAQIKPNLSPRTDTTWHEPFLAQIRITGNASYAARMARVERRLAYEHRARFPDFASAWDDAAVEAKEGLEFAAHQRALSQSDSLLMFLLCALDPEKYRDKRKIEITGQIALAMQDEIAKLLQYLKEHLAPSEYQHVCRAIEALGEGAS